MRRTRDTESASLSFLDVIACAFGAIVLLVLILPVGTLGIPSDSEPMNIAFQQLVMDKQTIVEELKELQNEIKQNSALLAGAQSSSAGKDTRVETTRKTIAATTQKIEETKQKIRESDAAHRKFVEQPKESPFDTAEYAGIPVDSDYVAIVLDTSTSMQHIWDRVTSEVEGVLSLYPEIKGFQILSDDGKYLLPNHRRKWIEDSSQNRDVALKAIQSWRTASPSSPAQGIRTALDDLYHIHEEMGLFVFGDDFSSNQDLDHYIHEIDRMVRDATVDAKGLRIHAVGFENEDYYVHSDTRFAVLLRELTQRYNGSFLALSMRERLITPHIAEE